MTPWLLSTASVLLPLAVLSASQAAAGSDPNAGISRRLYASVTDKAGKPVVDMTSAEFEVKEGGKIQAADARISTTPLRVALIVSDLGTGGFQAGALRFCDVLLGQAEIGITSLIVQPEVVAPYSNDPAVIRRGLQLLSRRGAVASEGAQLVETIFETSKSIRRDGTRPAIVIMRGGREATSAIRFDHVRDALRQSGAVMYVVSTARTDTALDAGSMGTSDMMTTLSILGDGSRESGGRQIQALGTRLAPTMEQIALELANQYEITYTLPPGVKASDSVSVSVKRRNVTLRAPTKIPND